MIVEKGLVIREPWIDLILDGQKTWEMRSQPTSFRGWLGLIRKGSGQVSGIARIADVGHPMLPDEMVASFDKHRIPETMIRSGEVEKWIVPWKLVEVRLLGRPVAYSHPNGAITLFTLDPAARQAISDQLNGTATPEQSTNPSPLPHMDAPKHVSQDLIPVATRAPAGSGLLIGETELTQGNLNNAHFYMRSFLNRFPDDLIGGPNAQSLARRSAIVDWGEPTPVETDIAGDKRLFRARGWVRDFFAKYRAEPGDKVQVYELAPYRYRVTLVKRRSC